jgi:hypothetical protein
MDRVSIFKNWALFIITDLAFGPFHLQGLETFLPSFWLDITGIFCTLIGFGIWFSGILAGCYSFPQPPFICDNK